jgi:AraC family transcriptional regulator
MGAFHFRPLLRGPLVSITDIQCRAPASGCGGEEHAPAHEVVFTRNGVFVKHVGRTQLVAEPTHALFLNRDEPYRVSHPAPGGDECTAVVYQENAVCDVVARWDPSVQERTAAGGRPFAIGHAPITPTTLLAYQRLRNRLGSGSAGRLEAEEQALAILDALISDGYRARGSHPAGARTETVHARRELAERTKETLATEPAAALSLADLARRVGSSPFHLARTFRDHVGIPVHQYLLRLRLAIAVDRLAAGERNLSALALELGFASHSHFTSRFVRAFGVRPSDWRATRRPKTARG